MQTRTRWPTLADLERRGVLDGYTAGPPRWAYGLHQSILREVAEQATCPACETRGLTLREFHKEGVTDSYVAYAVCPKCNTAQEL